MKPKSKELLLTLIEDALKEVDPARVIHENVSYNSSLRRLRVQQQEFQLEKGQQIYVLGSGKASAAMGQALEEVLGEAVQGGLIITPVGTSRDLHQIHLVEGSHPLPDENSLQATQKLIDTAGQIPEGSLVFYLISGGTSALLCYPAEGLGLEEVARVQQLLLNSGADIHQMNVVRTVISRVKGGQLLNFLSHVRLVDLIISDVPGDEFRSIGSGPTTPGEIEFARARRILEKHEIWNELPEAVRAHIETHIEKGEREGEKADDAPASQGPEPGTGPARPVVQKSRPAGQQESRPAGQTEPTAKRPQQPLEHHQFLVSSARKLAESVAGRFREKGFDTSVAGAAYNAPIDEVESEIVSGIRQATPPACLIWYGESSVNVTGSGKGGRNQELALRIARHLSPDDPVTVASVGTDGVDGPTDAAGAVVDGNTLANARKQGLDADAFLQNNDAWTFFNQTGELIRTGPTGNNLMDLQVALVGER